MHIGVDATSWQNNRGYGRHARALLGALVKLDVRNRYTLFMDSSERAELVSPNAKIRLLRPGVPTAIAASANGSRGVLDLWRMSRALSAPGLDILLFPTIYSFVPVITRAKKIVVIHDTIAETYPQLTLPRNAGRFLWQAKVALGRAQADVVVTVSEYSRRQIVSRFGLSADRVFVVGEAGDPVFRPLENPRITPALSAAGIRPGGRMIVYVGGFSPHKNLTALVRAFASICEKESFADTSMVMVGEYKKEV